MDEMASNKMNENSQNPQIFNPKVTRDHQTLLEQ